MPDISNLKIGETTYSFKDTTARETAETAETNSAEAKSLAQSANNKIDATNLSGNYTNETETLEILLMKGE